MNNSWKKLIIGVILLIGFVGYTQYKKSAEPAWKVNSENFEVIDQWDELMRLEGMKYSQLKFANHFNLIKDSNMSTPLSTEHRELRIEKTWNNNYQLYILYSVDLLERDKDESDIPRMFVDQIVLTSKNGEEFETHAETIDGETSSQGYVYKHRLYRSLIIYPLFENMDDSDWEKVMTSNRIKMKNPSLTSKKGVIDLDSIAFQVSPPKYNEVPETIASTPINKSVTLFNGNKVMLKDLEFYQIGSRITLKEKTDENVTAFLGEIKINDESFSTQIEITQDGKGHYFLPTYFLLDSLLNMDKSDTGVFTLTHSIIRTNETHNFFVSKNNIETVTKDPERLIFRNDTILKEKGVEFIYRGLAFDEESNQSVIKFILRSTGNFDGNYLYPQPSYYVDEMNSYDRNLSNLITIKTLDGKLIKDYEIRQDFQEDNHTFLIYFNNGIPVEELQVTLSNLTIVENIGKQVKVPLRLPEINK